MAAFKSNHITTCYDGKQGDREFIFAVKGRPFSVLTAPQFPTPAFTMIDHNLVRELKLRMTDLQCVKLYYGGQKLRILGKISTTVQCIIDGVPAGNMQFKAHVVQDIYQLFDTHSIAGVKMSERLVGKPFELVPEPSANPTKTPALTEPTKTAKRKRKKKFKTKQDYDSSSESSNSEDPPGKAKTPTIPKSESPSRSTLTPRLHIPKSPTPFSCSESPLLPTPPRSKCQGQWIQHHSYQGWHREHGYDRPDVLRCYYEDRDTRRLQVERPDDWDSGGSFHSPTSAKSYDASSDEYDNISTNVYADRFAKPVPEKPYDALPSSPNTSEKPYNQADQEVVHRLWKEGQHIPDRLQHVPIPHGDQYCHPDCLYLGDVPPECGYHHNWGPIAHCGPDCPGGWCHHTRTM